MNLEKIFRLNPEYLARGQVCRGNVEVHSL